MLSDGSPKTLDNPHDLRSRRDAEGVDSVRGVASGMAPSIHFGDGEAFGTRAEHRFCESG